jgi:hypothetical protein
MLNRYCHYNETQLLNNQIRNAKKKIDDIEEGKKCPNCETINNYNEKFCVKCKYILDTKELMKKVRKNISLGDTIEKQQKEINILRKEMKDYQDILADVLLVQLNYYLEDLKKGNVNYWTEHKKELIKAIDILQDK